MLIEDLPRNKHFRFLQAAAQAAFFSPGVGRNKNLKHGTVLVRKKHILAIKNNSSKTHPKLIRFGPFPHLHSESNAILSCGFDNCEDAVLYVVRILADKHLAISKPCNTCMKLIKYARIKKVYYSTYNGIENYVV